ncbi:MAG: phage tail assembly protein [Nitrospinae bacterium]|nr:phage tail assembly protein [Nitrospinota bacterium]
MESNESKEIVLPSGKKATLRKGKGRDLFNAQRKAKDPAEMQWALLSELVEIDGKKVVFEDLLEMDLPDVYMLNIEIAGGLENLSFPQSSISSTSQGLLAGHSKKSQK